jgi:hypothetical protein
MHEETVINDILEEASEAIGRDCVPGCEGDELNLLSERLLVFHPHGFLSR